MEFLTQNKKLFRDRFSIVKIGLFGSYARNEQTEVSDIDLIVEFESNTPNLYDVKKDLKSYIKEQFNIEVDIAREKYLKRRYRDSIIKETVYV